jgi:carboxylesterase type B
VIKEDIFRIWEREISLKMTMNHETLGQMRGIKSKDGKTIQYRGIKYANIPGRWQDAVISNSPLSQQETEFDATKHGLSCPQHPGGFAFDVSLIGDVKMVLEENEQDEFECLNLVVTVPAGIEMGARLPVFVW